MSLILPLMWSMDCLVVKVLKKIISLICFRVYLEVIVFKNPTCFSRWSVSNIGHETFGNCRNLVTIHYTGVATGSPWGAPNANVTQN